MESLESLVYWVRKKRGQWRRLNRILFPSPAEMRLIEVMDGRVLRVEAFVHWRTKFPLAFVVSRGPVFRREKVRREVRVGKHFIDFGNDIRRGIEVDGSHWHMDVLKDQQRDLVLRRNGWLILRIPAVRLWREPSRVQRDVMKFLEK